MTTNDSDAERLRRLDAETLAIQATMREAVKDAVRAHRRLGLPMVTWQDGEVVWIPSDQLPADEKHTTH